MLITIFTPTYNRAHTLERLYDSIKGQAGCPFEWIIVDDGSSDGTEQMVAKWQSSSKETFELRYFRQENSGKHVAWNKGLQEARGDIFFPVDSDDYLTPNALERIVAMAATVDEGDENIIAVSGTGLFPGAKLSGGTLESMGDDYLDYSSITRRTEGISGDLAEAFFTEKLRAYPFPVFPDERFVPEAVIFNRFSNDGFLIRGFAYPLYCCEYLPDGYTQNMDKLLINNWEGYTLYLKELLKSPTSAKAKAIPLCGYLYRWLLKGFHLAR